MSLDGERALIGARGDDDNSGSAYVFNVTTGQQLHKLTPTDGAEGDLFGHSVSLDGERALIGAPQESYNGTRSGSAYVFDVTTGQQLLKLLPTDGDKDDRFGTSVSLDGERALIGAIRDQDNGSRSGSAYVFDVTTGQQLRKLTPTDGTVGDRFGYSVSLVSLDGERALVGASGDEDNGDGSGSAYVFDVTTGQQLRKLTPTDGAARDYFGDSVSLDGERALIGAWRDDYNGTDSGSAYVFALHGGDGPIDVPDDCAVIGAIDICADTLTQNGDTYTASENIWLGNSFIIGNGSIVANTADGTISGMGDIALNQTGSDPVLLWSGDFDFDDTQTASGQLTLSGSGLQLTEFSNLALDLAQIEDTMLLLDVPGDRIELSGGGIELLEPYVRVLPLASYTLGADGSVGGSLYPTSLTIGEMTVDIDTATIDADGILASGDVTVHHLSDVTAPYTGLRITSNAMSQADGTHVDLVQFGLIDLALADLEMRDGVFEVVNVDGTPQLTIHATRSTLQFFAGLLLDTFVDVSTRVLRLDVDDWRILPDDLALDGGTLVLPFNVNLYNAKISGARFDVTRVPAESDLPNDYVTTIEGTLSNAAFPLQPGLFVRAAVYRDEANDLAVLSGSLGTRGYVVPLWALPPVFISQLDAGVGYELAFDEYFATGGGALTIGLPQTVLGGYAEFLRLRGDLSYGFESGWYEIAGEAIFIRRYQWANARLSVDKPGESEDGFYLVSDVAIADILNGHATLHDDPDWPYFRGTGSLGVQIPLYLIPDAIELFMEDVEPIVLAETAYAVGAFSDTEAGFIANHTLYDINVVHTFDFYTGEHDLGLGDRIDLSANAPQINSPYVVNARRGVALPADLYERDLVQPALSTQQDNSLVTLTGTPESVLFYLSAPDHQHLSMHLVDPGGDTITPDTSDPAINVGTNGGVAYHISNPAAGDWYLVVNGVQGGESYTVDAIVGDSPPTVDSAPQISGDQQSGFTVTWAGTDADGDATVALYADTDTSGTDGTLIADGLPISGMYSWDNPAGFQGDAYLYVEARDDFNSAQTSPYSSAISINDTTAPPIVTGLTVQGDGDRVRATWDESTAPDLMHYVVDITFVGQGSISQTTSDTQTDALRSSEPTEITVSVSAVDRVGNTSSPVSVTLPADQLDDLTRPAPPSDLAASFANDSITLTWTDNATNETGYLVQRRLFNAPTWENLATLAVDATEYVDTTAICGERYDYQVLAVRDDNQTTSDASTLLEVASTSCPANDLYVSALNVSNDLPLSRRGNLTLTLHNGGESNDTVQAAMLDIVYSMDATIGNEDDLVLRSVTVPEIAAGATENLSVNFDWPLSTLYADLMTGITANPAPGAISPFMGYVGIVVDPLNTVYEYAYEANNINQGLGIDIDAISYLPWDVSNDGVVAADDLIRIINRSGLTPGDAGYDVLFDLDGDDDIDNDDLSIVLDYLGYVVAPTISE